MMYVCVKCGEEFATVYVAPNGEDSYCREHYYEAFWSWDRWKMRGE